MSFLADGPGYGPTLLRARLNWKRPNGEEFQRGIYRLVTVRAGVHEVPSRGRTTQVEAGGTYFVQPGQWSKVEATRGASAILLGFTVTRCELKRGPGQPAWDLSERNHMQPSAKTVWGVEIPLVLDAGLSTSLASQVMLVGSLWWRSSWDHFRANNLLCEMLERIVTHYRESKESRSADYAGETWINKVYRLVDQRLSTIRTTSDLAAAFGMGRDRFARNFRSAAGQSPAAYLKQCRLNEAALMLRRTAWPIDQIARHVGYPSRGAFHQAWRKVYDTSPAKWRRETG